MSCLSSVLCTLMHGFFGNKQYAATAPNILTMKLSKHLCLVCSTWAMFLSSSFTVSMIALFLRRSLSETLSFLIANQMQFESEEPTHWALSSLSYAFEYLVNMYSLVLADTQWCAVNEAYARTFAQQYFLDKQSEWNDNLPFQFYYTVVWDNFRKQITQMFTYFFKIEMFKAAITRVVKKNHY